ncbi:unnamed protein product [Microthlaspi erraticum]|uniref:Uncharacterized protein n=1 Tax=Microthlaspi erraticum TaxID=1685480 RepID=A0A6D2L2S0_9BRAS|nr:unnamed protein product [Microthlaspi erraticum]
MQKESLDSDVILSITEYLSKHGYEKIANDLKAEAKIKAGNADKDDCFPQPVQPLLSNPLLTKFTGTKFTPGPSVLANPLFLLLQNMDSSTEKDDVISFFKEGAGVTVKPEAITLVVKGPEKNTCSSVELPGFEGIATKAGQVKFESWELTKKAMGLHGKFMKVRGVAIQRRNDAGMGRHVYISLAVNDLRTVCAYGFKKNEHGAREAVDRETIREMVSEEDGIEIISSISPEDAMMEYYLLRMSEIVAFKFRQEGGKVIVRGNCSVILSAISGLFEEVWEDITSGERVTLQLFLQEIVNHICESITSSSWASKKKSGKAICKLSEVLGESLWPHHNRLLQCLVTEIPGRLWEGKDALLDALGALSVSCHEAITKEDPTAPTTILSLICAACKKKLKKYRESAFSCLDKVIIAFGDPEFFNTVFPMLYEMCKTASVRTSSQALSASDAVKTGCYTMSPIL